MVRKMNTGRRKRRERGIEDKRKEKEKETSELKTLDQKGRERKTQFARHNENPEPLGQCWSRPDPCPFYCSSPSLKSPSALCSIDAGRSHEHAQTMHLLSR